MEYFAYQKPQTWSLTWQTRNASCRTGLLTFPSAAITGCETNDLARVHCLLPDRPGPAVICLHGLFERRTRKPFYLWKNLGEMGFAAFLLELPYHLDRTPPGAFSGSRFLSLEAERSVTAFRQAVVDCRSIVDIIGREPAFAQVAGQGVAAVGVSLGALIVNTLFCVEKRISAAVSVLGAGNISAIFVKSPATLPLVLADILKGTKLRHYRQVVSDYRAFLKELAEKGPDRATPAWPWFSVDPLTCAMGTDFRSRDFLMINARGDLVIPRRQTLEFWKAAGKPPIAWLPCTHYTAFVFQRRIAALTAEFLKKHLGFTAQR